MNKDKLRKVYFKTYGEDFFEMDNMEELMGDMTVEECMSESILTYYQAAGFDFEDIDEVLAQFGDLNYSIEEMKKSNELEDDSDVSF